MRSNNAIVFGLSMIFSVKGAFAERVDFLDVDVHGPSFDGTRLVQRSPASSAHVSRRNAGGSGSQEHKEEHGTDVDLLDSGSGSEISNGSGSGISNINDADGTTERPRTTAAVIVTTTTTTVQTPTTPNPTTTNSSGAADESSNKEEDGGSVSGKGIIAIVVFCILVLVVGLYAFVHDHEVPKLPCGSKDKKEKEKWSIQPKAFANPTYAAPTFQLLSTDNDGGETQTEPPYGEEDRASPDDLDFTDEGAEVEATTVHEGDSDAVIQRKNSVKDRTRLKKSMSQDVLTHEQAMSQGITEEMFKEMDTDGDGKLSPAEISQWKARKQMEADNNKLQQMLAKDVARMSHEDAIAQGMTEEQFNAIDVDGDGELTAAEISAWKEANGTTAAADSTDEEQQTDDESGDDELAL
jgi:Ca2+-binding EF-hand superfamily protein